MKKEIFSLNSQISTINTLLLMLRNWINHIRKIQAIAPILIIHNNSWNKKRYTIRNHQSRKTFMNNRVNPLSQHFNNILILNWLSRRNKSPNPTLINQFLQKNKLNPWLLRSTLSIQINNLLLIKFLLKLLFHIMIMRSNPLLLCR